MDNFEDAEPSSSRNCRVRNRRVSPEVAVGIEEKCSWCFSLKGAAISSILFVVIVASIVFALDVSIIEALRNQREDVGRYRHEDTDKYKQRRLKLEQQGGEFEQMLDTHFNYGYLNLIDLNGVNINITNLTRYVRSTHRLEVFTLRNVTFYGKLPARLRDYYIYFRRLSEFSLDFRQEIGPDAEFQLDHCDTCIYSYFLRQPLERMRQFPCLKALLGFISTESTKYVLQPSYSETKIHIKIGGCNYLKILPAEGQLTTMFSDCDRILMDMLDNSERPKFQFKKIALNGCHDLKPSTLQRILANDTLTHLTLDNVTLAGVKPGEVMSQMFQNLTTLEHLILKGSPYANFSETTMLTVDLQHFPKSLKKLALSNVRIVGDTVDREIHLDILVLVRVLFDDIKTLTLVQDSLVFRRLAAADLMVKMVTSPANKPDPQLETFFNKVMTKPSMEWIILKNYIPSLDSNFLNVNLSNSLKKWINFRTTDTSLGHLLVPYSVFKKDSGKWRPDFLPPTLEAREQLWFDLYDMSTFYQNRQDSRGVW